MQAENLTFGDYQFLLQDIIDRFIINDIREELPPDLYFAHLTLTTNLNGIVSEKGLITPLPEREDDDDQEFGQFVYFSYGGVFHRVKYVNDDVTFPVAFLFNCNILKQINYYYPLDTGAVLKDMMPSRLSRNDLHNFRIESVGRHRQRKPGEIVSFFYVNNDTYLDRIINYKSGLTTDVTSRNYSELSNRPYSQLIEVLNKDLRNEGIDHRKNVIECLAEDRIDIRESLVWVCTPQSWRGQIYKLLAALNISQDNVHFQRYPGIEMEDATTIENPTLFLQEKIQSMANNFIRDPINQQQL